MIISYPLPKYPIFGKVGGVDFDCDVSACNAAVIIKMVDMILRRKGFTTDKVYTNKVHNIIIKAPGDPTPPSIVQDYKYMY